MRVTPRIPTPKKAAFWLSCAIALASTNEARAERVSEGEDDTPLWAARACYVEASFRKDDCVALLWVTRKRAERAGRPWVEMIREYSAVDANTPRAEESRAFPWGDVAGRSDAWNRNWSKLRGLALEVASGKRRDPCPRAVHWGGTMDHPRGRMVLARCAVSTANTFYALSRRTK